MLDEKAIYSIVDKAKKYDELIKFPITAKEVSCHFCGKSQSAVSKIIASSEANICDECIESCVDILRKDNEVNEVIK